MDKLKSMADLLDLQEVDSAIDKMLNDRANLPELTEYRTAHESAAEAAAALAVTSERLREVLLATDKADGELELAEQKLGQEEMRLFAGGMSAKETEYMRLEVDSLRRQCSGLEDELLELLDQRETAEAENKTAGETNDAAAATEKRLEGAIADAWKALDAEIARKEQRKDSIAPEVDEELMELYSELRASRGGVVVGALDGRTCGACHMELSAAEHHEVLRDDPPRCIHCGAILVP